MNRVDEARSDAPLRNWPAALDLMTALLAGRTLPPQPFSADDWREFTDLVVQQHRVAQAVLDAAAAAGLDLPGDVFAALSREAASNATLAFRQKAETVRILSALAETGCQPVVLKGWPLAEALYGSATVRQAKDIDLYIDMDEIDPVLSVLGRLGYAVDHEHSERARFVGRPAFRSEFNDINYYDSERGIQVEVHWRSYHFRGWPDLRDIPAPFEERKIDNTGIGFRVPSPAANLIYLSLHGQQHLWLRLKWLLDIARFIAARSDDQLLADLATARRAGAGRAVVMAGHLARAVLDLPLPRGWPDLDNRGSRAMAKILDRIGDRDVAPGGFRARLSFYWSSLCLAESLSQRLGVMRYGFWRRLRCYRASRSVVGG